MDLVRQRIGLPASRIVLLGLSFVSLVLCAVAAAAHYLHWAWGNPWQPISWLLSMLLLLAAFSPSPQQIVTGSKSLLKPKVAFFAFWILVFAGAHLWNFSTAPWNGNGLFDESAWDLYFLKHNIIGHPFQPVWPDHTGLTRETLFHYYVWGFLRLFDYNILSYEAALFVIWCTTFVFTLLLIDLFFRSYIVNSLAALIFTFLPFAFIFSFGGFRYPMGMALCMMSLYFLHLGFKKSSSFYLSVGGITAGLCLASSTPGKQYVLVLLVFAMLYASLHWRVLTQSATWRSVSLIAYGFVIATMPIFFYIAFNYQAYTYYEKSLATPFFEAMLGKPAPNDLRWYFARLGVVFFANPADRLFIPDALLIPLPYYFFLVPGLVLAGLKKRYEIVLLATIPVVLALIAAPAERRLLLALPAWIILMGFALAGLLTSKLRMGLKVFLWGASVVILIWGLIPSIQYIHNKTKDPLSIFNFTQEQVAVSRFLKAIVAGREPANPLRLERDEFNRIEGIPDPPYGTLICQNEAYSIIHLFLHDYNDREILSLCGGSPMYVMTDEQIWKANKKTLAGHVPRGKDLKLIWEKGATTERIIKLLEPLRSFGTEESISFLFAGREREFYVLNIGSQNIRQFQEQIQTLPNSLR